MNAADSRSGAHVQSEQNTSGQYFEFRDVCKSFRRAPDARSRQLRSKARETCVIMGRSGVGKSVSLKHIMGFLKRTRGRFLATDRTSRVSGSDSKGAAQGDHGLSVRRALRLTSRLARTWPPVEASWA